MPQARPRRDAPHALVCAVVALLLLAVPPPGSSSGIGVETVPLPSDPPGPPPLLQPGPYPVDREEYDLGATLLAQPSGLVQVLNLRGNMHFPADGAGPFPLVMMLHGQHSTCRVLGMDAILVPGDTACRYLGPATEPIRNYAGFDYLAAPLASYGYVVVSADAGDINDLYHLGPYGTGDFGIEARAQLLLRTIDQFARINDGFSEDPVTDRLVGRLDLSRVGLMGHSRGGEAVIKALHRDLEAGATNHRIAAVFALAPTDFLDITAPNVPFAVMLPYCDGDVNLLVGGWIWDDTRYLQGALPAPAYQLLVMGANHNWFNSLWTGDEAPSNLGPDPYCDPAQPDTGRLTAEAQREVGKAYVEGFFRLHLGGERALQGLFTGAGDRRPACNLPVGTCPGTVHASYHAPQGSRRVVEDADEASALFRNDLGGDVRLSGGVGQEFCLPKDCPSQPNVARAHQLTLRWEGPGAYASLLPPGEGDVRGYDLLTFRAGVNVPADAPAHKGIPVPLGPQAPDAVMPPLRPPQDLRVELEDAHGSVASVRVSDHSLALFSPPGWFDVLCPDPPCHAQGGRKVTLNMVRLPLAAFEGLDLAAVRAVRFVFDQTPQGSLQLADLLFQAEALP